MFAESNLFIESHNLLMLGFVDHFIYRKIDR